MSSKDPLNSPHNNYKTHRSPPSLALPSLLKQGEAENLPTESRDETGMDLVDAEVKPIWAQPRPGPPMENHRIL